MQTSELLKGKRATTRVAPTCAALLLALFFCADLQAQVTIGGLTEPQKGAILDLNSDVKGGLVLSNVTITDPEKIPHDTNVFQGITSANEDVNMELRGAMVYNDGNGTTVPPGVYIWNGSCWTTDGGEVIINPPAITVDGTVKFVAVTTLGSSTAVTLAVASPQPDVSYEWYQSTTGSIDDGISTGTTGETYITPDNLTAGTYYYCKATSLACPSVNAVSGVITVVVHNPSLPSGNGILTGASCFDVAVGNDGSDGCGVLSSRTKRIFTNSFTEVYTFSVLSGSAAVTGLSFDFKNLNATYPVIQSLDWSENTVTVTFHTELDTWAQGLTREQALKAELYAVYNTDKVTKLTLSVSDCQCCPGLLVVGGEYNNIAATISFTGNGPGYRDGHSAAAVITYFTPAGYDLCYYKRDANSTMGWNSAVTTCQTTTGVDAADAHDDWRLPNIAELAQIGQVVSSYTPSGGLGVGVGSQTHVNAAISGNTGYNDVIALPGGSYTTTGTYNLVHNSYHSSTAQQADLVWRWDFTSVNRNATNANKTYPYNTRCVRRFY